MLQHIHASSVLDASTSKPIFDGTFGANCPPCKEFGQTVLKKLYSADGIADAVDFQMHSAIRSAGDPSIDQAWACPDEEPGCPMTKWFICAVDGWNQTTTTQDQQVNFLICWDDSMGTLKMRTKKCAKVAGLNMVKIEECQRSTQGEALQVAAADAFEKRFPTHAHSGIFNVPHIFIGGKEVDLNDMNYNSVLKSLCETGIEARACKAVAGMTASQAKPVFDGTFGANCPPCKEFGQTVLKKLYAADGIADAVDFQMHSAIRSAGDPSTDHAWACPDEDTGCPMTKWFICAIDGWNQTTTTQDQQVNFLTCWDDSTGTLEDRTAACAKAVGLDMASITACQSGAKGEALQVAAAEAFEKRFPTHAHSGMFEVPHLFINGAEVGINSRDYDSIMKALCATGIKADACSQYRVC